MSVQQQDDQQAQGEAKERAVRVEVDYLPAVEDYDHPYQPNTIIETIRSDAMRFFGVEDRTVGRDIYKFYLVHGGTRLDNTQVPLEQIVGEHAHHAKFTLVEEITQGSM